MERVAVDDVAHRPSTATVKRPLGDALGVEGFAMHQYVLDPGDSFSTGLHTHLDQEEVFYVQSGTATFETDEGAVAVGAGEVIRFPPGEYQRGHNATDGRVTALVLGAPRESEEGRIECPDCGARAAPVTESSGGAIRFSCRDCGAEIDRQT